MKYFVTIILILLTVGLHAQTLICPDVDGAIDHPIINKYKNSCIVAYNESKFNSVTFPASKVEYLKGEFKASKEVTVEGSVTSIVFGIENTQKSTVLEVQRNYEQALQNGGFEIVYSGFGRKNLAGSARIQDKYPFLGDFKILEQYQSLDPKSYFRFSLSHHNSNVDNDDAYFLAQGKRDGKIYTLSLFIHYNRTSWEGLTDNIFIQATIVEKEDMESGQVTTASIEEKIKNEGKEVFHNILFDTGSDKLTPESYPVIETLAKYLKSNSDNEYLIVGHTDNTGNLKANQELSKKRANAVLNALITEYGVNPSQISAHGVGQLSPLSINTTEEGRSLNRRVEVVLK